jgi:hypothetical protein
MRANLGFALVCMINSTALTSMEPVKNATSNEFQQCKLPAETMGEVEMDLGYHVIE